MELQSPERLILRRAQLFAELDEEAFQRLARLASVVRLEAGAPLFVEGDEPDRFYVVLDGQCDVVKRARDGRFVDIIATVEPGQSVGELPLIEAGPRSATVRASRPTTLAAFPIEPVRRELFETHRAYPYLPFLRELESHLVTTVKRRTEQSIRLLEERAHSLEHQKRMSVFIIYVITVLCAFMFVLAGLTTLTQQGGDTTAITLPVIVIIGIVLLRPIRALGLGPEDYGITTRHWRASLRDGLVLSVPLLAAVTLAKAVFVALSDAHAHLPIVDLFGTDGVGEAPPGAVGRWLLFNLAYVGVIVPLQEFISRGLLQGLLERFIESKHRTLLAIVISNLVFAAFHLYISIGVAVLTLLLGACLGWLYTRTRNLLGPCVAHAITGVWALTIVRLQPMLF
jgi:CRP-like cAMP-binding protein